MLGLSGGCHAAMLFDVDFVLTCCFNSYFFVTNTLYSCTSFNNVESLSSDVSLAVYNKLNVSVGFIRKSRKILSMCEFPPSISNVIFTDFLLRLVFQKVSL